MVIFLLFLLGLCVGSFLNVVILRIPSGQTIGWDRSRCPRCGRVLNWYELIPVFSFVVQKGLCRGCHTKISWQYPLVESVVGVLFVFSFYNYLLGSENLTQVFLKVVAGIALLVVFMIDLKFGLVLDQIVWPAVILVFLLQVLNSGSWVNLLLGSFIAGGFFGAQFFVSKGRWIGSGDIEIGVFMGILLGWRLVLVALFLAYVGGAIISLILLAFKKKNFQSTLPFGIFLAPATWVALLWGDKIISWYLNLLGV